MAGKKSSKKGRGGKRTKRAGASAEGCKKAVDKCGMSVSICDISQVQRGVTEARKEAAQTRQWAKDAAKRNNKIAAANIKAANDAVDAFRKQQRQALASCRKTAATIKAAESYTHPDSSNYMNGLSRRFRRRVRR